MITQKNRNFIVASIGLGLIFMTLAQVFQNMLFAEVLAVAIGLVALLRPIRSHVMLAIGIIVLGMGALLNTFEDYVYVAEALSVCSFILLFFAFIILILEWLHLEFSKNVQKSDK